VADEGYKKLPLEKGFYIYAKYEEDMKRGQLGAVLIIVLLVVVVAGFLLFSQKSIGKAATTMEACQLSYDKCLQTAPTANDIQNCNKQFEACKRKIPKLTWDYTGPAKRNPTPDIPR